MKTKILIAFALIICAVSFCSCGSFMTGKRAIMKVEKGMIKKDVVSLLGEPDFRRFNEQMEEWEYKKMNPLTSETTIIIVDFIDERVSNMNTFSGDNNPNPPVAVYPPHDTNYGKPSYPPHPDDHGKPSRAINEEEFQQLYNKVKQKLFKDDQLELLEMGVTNKYFTCKQCLRLMSIYTFDDDKLEVLEIVASRIVDTENYKDIVKSLSFISSGEKAEKILRRTKK